MNRDFKDLEIWKEALRLVVEIYKVTKSFPKTERYSLTDQLRKSSNSTLALIAESQGRYHFADKIRVPYQARGEAYETRSHLSVACKLRYIDKRVYKKLDEDYKVLSKRISSYIKYLESRKKK